MNFLTNKSTISPGDIQFFDAIEPPLLAGGYSLSANQTIDNVPNPDGPTTPTYTTNKSFIVKGPQFFLKTSAIHSMYPPPLALGTFDNVLPNVVMTDMSLPWSRPINPLKPEEHKGVPWMGLLTIYPDEITQGAKKITDTNKVLGPFSVSISELLTPGGDIQGPDLDAADIGISMDTKVTVVDIDFKTFQSIAPTIEELPFLAHGRAVNTDGKVMLGMEGDGYFSLLIGNRLPKAGTEDTPAVNNIFLVSFEGYSDYLRGGSSLPDGKKLIRLVLLNSWNFKASAAKASFLTLMADLCKEGRGGVKLMQMPGANETIENETAKKALKIGYTALQNDMRVGETATSWYRPPLVPAPTKRDLSTNFNPPYLYSDHAMHYDPENGIFNHTYSAAWQIGRLLALSDGSFAKGFFEWRNNYINDLNEQSAQDEMNKNAARVGSVDVSKQTSPVGIVQGVQSLFANKIKDVEWPKFEARQASALGEHLPGVLTEEEKNDILDNDEDPLMVILNK